MSHGSDSTPTRRRQQMSFVAKLEASTALRYSLAPACIAAAVLLHVSFVGPYLHPTGLFVVGIVAAAWFGGAGPGFLAALLATFVLPHFVPRLYPLIADFFDLPRFLTFAITGLAVGWGTTFRRRAETALLQSEAELRKARSELETKITERTADLRFSEERYALAIEASGEGHWDWNIVTDECYISPRLLEMYGFRPGTTFKGREDFLARFPLHPEDRLKWEEAVAAHFADRTARFELEIRMLPRGETRWFHLTGVLTRDSSGKPVRWTGSVADITERKCAEDALRLSEQRYALAMEATGDGHWDWNIPADKMYVSPLLLDMCGLPADSTFVSRSEWVERFPFYPGERPRYAKAVADHFAGKTDRVDMEIRIVPRGETRWVHMTGRCSRDPSGTPIRWAGSVTDITARMRIDEELRARQDMLDLAQKAARAVAFEWRVGEEGENRWSPDLEAMYGIPTGSYDGTYESWKRLIYPDDWPNVRAAIKAAQASGEVAAEYRVAQRGGAIRWLQAKGRMF